ncbi:hypothetical protein KJ673_03195 [Patescibacteria group bacterium]|nr:hypothetical protein [Patescibacteria group bacterium]MCG2687831.1 pyruvate kinase [Candidatus Parcubacteria bacterium]
MQIIATVWKKPYNPAHVQAMIDAGVDALRVKCSHDGADEIAETLLHVREQINASDRKIDLIVDLPEAKLRLGQFPQERINISEGQEFRFLYGPLSSNPLAYIPFVTENLADNLKIGEKFFVQDGNLQFEVIAIHSPNEFIARSCHAGELVQSSVISITDMADKLNHIVPFIDEMLEKLPESKPDVVAFSFIKSRAMLEELISKLKKYTSDDWNPQVLAKIESKEGIDNIDEILGVVHGIIIARGDLALTTPFEILGLTQKYLVSKVRRSGKYCVVATGTLTSMLSQALPARSDILDITNSCLDGASAIMLCNETAHHKNPGQVVETAKKIINAVESY